jgi:hypothetical protein
VRVHGKSRTVLNATHSVVHTERHAPAIAPACALAALIFLAVAALPVAANPGTRSDGRSRFTAVVPCRLADTRLPGSGSMRISPSVIRIQVTGRCDINRSSTAVALSVTVTSTETEGYAVVTAATTSGPTSTINWARGETRASSTVVGVSATGAVDVQVSPSLDVAAVVVDVTGAWAMVSGPVRGGRLVAFAGRRVLDTRDAGGRMAAGDSISVDRATLDIPQSAVAVAGTLTTSGSTGAGYLTAYPAGSPVPVASNVNSDQAGQDRAAGIIVALGADGLSLYAGATSTDIVLDITGYVTGDTDVSSTEGLLIVASPRRVLDTRSASRPLTTSATAHIGEPFVGAQVAGVIATVTMTGSVDAGYVALGSEADRRSPTSALNWPDDTAAVAAMTIQPITASKRLDVASSAPAALIVDVTGYLLGPNAANGPALLLPGASALAGGVIEDTTGIGRANGDALGLLTEVYTPGELAAGGGVSIVRREIPGGGAALVPYDPQTFAECGPQPTCILVSADYWDSVLRGGRDANRVMISHEWAHVLSRRYQAWADDVALAEWSPRHDAVHEECLADVVAAEALQRAGLPGNETPTYTVHYMCDEYWAGIHGPDAVATTRTEAATLAADLLAWADAWGTAQHTSASGADDRRGIPAV